MPAEFEAVRTLLEQAVAQRYIPGAVAVVGTRTGLELVAAFGVRRYPIDGEKARFTTAETVFDLASLSKVTGTLPSILKLLDAGEIAINETVGHFFSNADFQCNHSVTDVTVQQLLTHSSGLPAGEPLFTQIRERSDALVRVLQTELAYPPGTVIYSDLGFILLGAIIEKVSGSRQDSFVKRFVLDPLEMRESGYGPITNRPVAATEACSWRGKLLEGEVHDENAYAMDGIAGHAGLFSTGMDLARYAQAWLRQDAPFARPELLRVAIEEHVVGQGSMGRRGLGWQLKSEGSSVGRLASPSAFGHTGFTGTSLWCDPEQDWFAVLLTNRVHPRREKGQEIHALRVAFHEAVARQMQC